MSAKYRMAVVDDHALVRRGLIENLEDEADFDVVGEGGCCDDAIKIARNLAPDLMFLDVNMPGGGLNAAARIQAMAPGVRIAMFSFRQDLAIVRASLEAGAVGYIIKGISGQAFNAATRRMLAGETYLEPDLARRLAQPAET